MAPRTDRSRRTARRRLAVGALVLAVTTVVVLAAFAGTAGSPGRSHPDAPAAGSTTSVPPVHPPYPVGSLTVTVTEPATGGTPARTFTTYVRYPAEAEAQAQTPATDSPGAAPAAPLRSAGPFPLVVFSGGFAVSPEEYAHLLDAWAAAGFVVADPVYPSTSPSPGQPLDEGDIVHHPADLSAVITALIGAAQGAGTGSDRTLAGMVDTGEIAAVGHSDGGNVTLAAAADSCCRDPRIRAVAILSGAEDALFGGTYFAGIPAVPLLAVQGTADEINPPGCSVELYDQAPGPKYFLSLAGQSHQGPYLQTGTAQDTVQQVVVDFLAGTLEGSGPALAAVTRDGNVPGSSTLTQNPLTGAAAGGCPGAPGG